MTAEQREILEKYESKYISLGITEDGEKRSSTAVYWESTATAFNMKIPNVYISRQDLLDEELMKTLSAAEVYGVYSYVPLEDYAFLERFPKLYDLNIFHGEGIGDLSFLKPLTKCKMLFIADSSLKDLSTVAEIKKASVHKPFTERPFTHMCLYNCTVTDTADLEDEELRFTELIIYDPKDKNEINRWKGINALTF